MTVLSITWFPRTFLSAALLVAFYFTSLFHPFVRCFFFKTTSTIIPERVTLCNMVKTSFVFYGTRRIITLFISSCHWCQKGARLIHSKVMKFQLNHIQ